MTSWTFHFLAPIILMTLSALVLSTLGVLHLIYTFHGPKLTPRDPDLQARMAEVHPVITRQTTMWRAWVGFNASHSMGAILFGLIYGYIPFMILPLFGTLDRMDRSMIEAARDLGAGQVKTFFRVTLPLSKQGILAGCIIVALPMFGDYFTQTLLSSTRNTAMFGNLIVSSIQSSLVNTGAALVVVMVVLLIVPMLYYLRSTNVARELAER